MRWNVSLAALASSWGFISVIGAYVHVDASALAFFRVALGAATIALALTVAGRAQVLVVRSHRLLLVAVGLVLAGHWALWFETVKLSSVAVALVTIYTAPLYLSILAPMLLRERRSRVALAALVPGLGGIALIALVGDGGAHARPLAIATGVGSGILYAFLVIGTKKLTAQLPSVTVQFWQCVVGAIALAPLLAVGGRATPHGVEIPLVLVLGVVYTGGSYLLFVALVHRVKAQAAGILMYLEPVSAALLAWALLDQQLTWAVVAGGVLVVLAGLAVILYEPADGAAAPVRRGRARPTSAVAGGPATPPALAPSSVE